jgi:hypothetical protein
MRWKNISIISTRDKIFEAPVNNRGFPFGGARPDITKKGSPAFHLTATLFYVGMSVFWQFESLDGDLKGVFVPNA